jgi:hypothetical protein
MTNEYRRIYARSQEDPGTAGDEGESNWADLLRDWLPSDLQVTTKGRILGTNGMASPQVDVVVLSGDYPNKLLSKKMYMAGGVVAAFECKTTLRRSHLPKFFANAAIISEIAGHSTGTIYDETFSPISYGLLAHGHEGTAAAALEAIDEELDRLSNETEHPRNLPSVICVNSLRTWQKRCPVLNLIACQII